MALIVDHINGIEGRVEVKGLRAVVAMFIRWSLERLGESQSGEPTWTLRAALSYQKDSLLTNKRLTKRVFIKLNSEKSYEAVPLDGVNLVVNGNNLVLEGVILWPVPQPSSLSPRTTATSSRVSPSPSPGRPSSSAS